MTAKKSAPNPKAAARNEDRVELLPKSEPEGSDNPNKAGRGNGANSSNTTVPSGDRAVSAAVAATGSERPTSAVKLKVSAIPSNLKKHNRWILWKYTQIQRADGTKKWTKTPHSVDGHRVDATKFANGTSFVDAVQALKGSQGRFDGLGFLLGDGIAGIDVDDCIDENGNLDDRGQRISEAYRETYAEVSPSGRGFKVLVNIGDDPKLALIGKNSGGMEIYGGRRYFTVTGALLPGHKGTIASLPEAFTRTAEQMGVDTKREAAATDMRAKQPLGIGIAVARELLDHLPFRWCDEYGDWLRAGMALHHEFGGSPGALRLWDEWSQQSGKFDAGACASKWQTFGKPVKEEVTIRTLVRDAERTDGWRAPQTIDRAIREFGPLDAAPSDNDALKLYNPLTEPPKRIDYMLGAPIWLPDLSEQVSFFGRSESFKSVWLQAICVYMAAGVSLDGAKVSPRVVVYAAEEAPNLWDNNLHAWRNYFARTLTDEIYAHACRNLEAGYLKRVDGNIGGLSDKRAGELAELVLSQKRELGSTARPVVALDPLAEVMQGDENKSEDMRRYIAAGRLIQRKTEALVLHIQHTGHSNTDRERGSSTFPAAMFARFEVQRPSPGAYSVDLHCKKHKARAKPPSSKWDVRIVPLLPDCTTAPDDEPLAGAVVCHVGEAAPPVSTADVQAAEREQLLADLLREHLKKPDIGGKTLRTALGGIGGPRLQKLREEAVRRGWLAKGAGEGRADLGLTDAGRDWMAQRDGDDSEDPLT